MPPGDPGSPPRPHREARPIRTRERITYDQGQVEGSSLYEHLGESLIGVVDFDAEGNCTCRVDYAYDQEGRNILRLVRWGERLAHVLVYRFDATGRKVQAEEYDGENRLAQTTRYEYLDAQSAIARVYGPQDTLLSEKQIGIWEIGR
jgi:hypothetical protein